MSDFYKKLFIRKKKGGGDEKGETKIKIKIKVIIYKYYK